VAVSGVRLVAFEEDLFICAECRVAVEEAEEYLCAMQEAARRLRAEQRARLVRP
jgi:hypothetical protein